MHSFGNRLPLILAHASLISNPPRCLAANHLKTFPGNWKKQNFAAFLSFSLVSNEFFLTFFIFFVDLGVDLLQRDD